MRADTKNVVFILKTMNFKHDQRIHKEVSLLQAQGINIYFIVKSVDEISASSFFEYNFIRSVKWYKR